MGLNRLCTCWVLKQLSGLTVHFGVGLPLVVPASEGLAVVLSALLGPEVHSIRQTWSSVTQLVETAGA